MKNNGSFHLNPQRSEDSEWHKELKRCMDPKTDKIQGDDMATEDWPQP
jgi:hypothetical protein